MSVYSVSDLFLTLWLQAAEKLLSTFGRESKEEPAESGTDLLSDVPVPDNVVLTATDEFCRNLGSMPTYGLSGNRAEGTHDELMVSVRVLSLNIILRTQWAATVSS